MMVPKSIALMLLGVALCQCMPLQEDLSWSQESLDNLNAVQDADFDAEFDQDNVANEYNDASIAENERAPLWFKDAAHSALHAVSSVAKNPAVQSLAKSAISAALVARDAEEEQEMTDEVNYDGDDTTIAENERAPLWFKEAAHSAVHAVSSVAKNPAVQSLAKSAISAAMNRHKARDAEEDQEMTDEVNYDDDDASIAENERAPLWFKEAAHSAVHAVSSVAKNPAVQSLAKSAISAAINKNAKRSVEDAAQEFEQVFDGMGRRAALRTVALATRSSEPSLADIKQKAMKLYRRVKPVIVKLAHAAAHAFYHFHHAKTTRSANNVDAMSEKVARRAAHEIAAETVDQLRASVQELLD